MTEEMERDESIFLIGEEVAQYNGAYKVSQGMLSQFGPSRVVDTPISEAGFAGLGIGAAMVGMRPIVEFMIMELLFGCLRSDHQYRSQNISDVRRAIHSSYCLPRAQWPSRKPRSTALNKCRESLCTLPGLKVVTYATADDAYGLLKTAIRDNNPVVFLESEMTYGMKGEVPDEEYSIPFGKARMRRTGSDITIITWGKQVFRVMEAVKQLEAQGFDPEVLDLRSIRPLDQDAIFNSVAKTGRCLITHEGHIFAGVGAENCSTSTTGLFLLSCSSD